ncbi:PD-(D/E)XK nuclease family protein [Andreprevotia chitinilytica]|uniref:PD-(D/E)XK nuclease family protein n=1 Tax=Andreprevotia chitinilytica TaxID=396808 RepID=UPI000690B504|nr:PD-(D/E)XK nuclease family protein [Andreprevotia chitinilytica]
MAVLPEETPISFVDVLRLPVAGTVLLTVNNRLARRLAADVLAQHAANGQLVAELPVILPLSAWLASLDEATAFLPDVSLPAHRFDDFAAQLIWAQAIHSEEKERPIFDERQLAALATQADALQADWDVRIKPDEATEEAIRYSHWQSRYRKLLTKLDGDDDNQRIERVSRLLERGQLTIPSMLILAGFRELSPRLTRLLTAIAAHGCRIHHLLDDGETATEPPRRFAATDRTGEWRAAAGWAAQQLAAKPESHFAILAPRLENDAPFARRVLLDAMGSGDAFNVAIGRPLADWPLARAALAWLVVLTENKSWQPADLGAALLAGHCAGDAGEAAERARIDARWRQRGVLKVDRHDWLRELFTCPRLSAAWLAAKAIIDDGRRNVRCDDWAKRFSSALDALGFPGERGLDSVAFQVMNELQAMLGRFAALAPAAGELNARAAVQLLTRLARETPFQPERSATARLDVLGLLEAEGGRWDGVWILGLTDDILPSIPKPNPLLPLSALRAAGAPRSTPERELAYAHELFERLCQCAPNIIVSHAELDGERELRASPLIAALPEFDWIAPAAALAKPAIVERLQDEQGPALNERDTVAGGTGVLETQAKNPQWAFVRYRLGAQQLPAYAEQFTANLRGIFLHRAMEALWRALQTSQVLQAARADGSLASRIGDAVTQAATDTLGDLPEAIRVLEAERAVVVIREWLLLEAQRLPFTVVATESPHVWRHGPLNLKLRLDRLDRDEFGGAVIIDYKTGKTLDTSGWARERPTELQLPLYAAVIGEDVTGLVLARLNAREVSAKGLAAGEFGLPGVKTTAELDERKDALAGVAWHDLLGLWQGRIAALADEFVAGYAANVTANIGDLNYCDVLPFLRVALEEEADSE